MKLVLRIALVAVALSVSTFAQKPEEELLKRAIAELQAGNTANAIAALSEHIAEHPKHVDAYLLRSNLRMTSGDTAGALADINKVIQLKPELAQAYHERAYLRIMARDTSGAIQDLDTAIKYKYQGDHVYLVRGQLRMDLGDLKGALADFDEANKLNPGNPQTYASRSALLLTLEDRDRALVDLNYLLSWYETDPTTKRESKTSPSEKPAATDKTGSFTVGIDTKTTNAAPGDKEMVPVIANAYTNRGLIHTFQGKADEAIADYTKSIRLDPKNLWAHYNRAKELAGKGDLEAALADVNRAIQLDPRNGNFRVEHGVILTLMGNTKEAQMDFDMLLNSDRDLWQKRIDERLAAVKKKLPN
jgi:tetratricopeptide (TPR) repeat protein